MYLITYIKIVNYNRKVLLLFDLIRAPTLQIDITNLFLKTIKH
jgi:hypothetical protein